MSSEQSAWNGRAVITGGLGFIGSNLAHRLVRMGAEVIVVDSLLASYGGNLFNVDDIRDLIHVNISDIRDRYALPRLVEKADVIFNLAGQTSHLDSMTDPLTDIEINATSQLALLETCRSCNPDARIVFASTRQIYGRPRYLPVDEVHPISPVDVNGINKLAGEQYHMLYHQVYGLSTCALRLTNTYGPRMRVRDARQTFLGIWVKNAITGVPIRVYGDGTQLRDFTYVDDCVDALISAALSPNAAGQIYNVGGPEVIDLLHLAELLTSIVSGASYEVVPFPGDLKAIDIGDYYADDSKIRAELDWSPGISLKEGLERTVSYYQAYGANY